MRSKAHFRSHPIHPALIPFPLAFLIGTLGFNAAGVFTNNVNLWRTGGLLAWAGIAAALIAAVPGFVDFIYTVPPNSTGKQRALKHMTVNLSAVALFTAAAVTRGAIGNEPGLLELVMQLIGVGLLTAGGWMGGVLVSRNQISVDHRYAGAGKWREERIAGKPGELVKVARADELKLNQMKLLHTGVGRIVLARADSGWVAFDDHCTHRGGSLADGVMICGTVQCPWHGSQFDARNGAIRAGPAREPIRCYDVEQKADEVYLRLKARPV